jgi:hypothetical protein
LKQRANLQGAFAVLVALLLLLRDLLVNGLGLRGEALVVRLQLVESDLNLLDIFLGPGRTKREKAQRSIKQSTAARRCVLLDDQLRF